VNQVFAHSPSTQNGENAQPTSPWTEAYQNTPQFQMSNDTAQQPERSFDRDDQRPTHDALFLIYNQGY
jgi:hypothetical protein